MSNPSDNTTAENNIAHILTFAGYALISLMLFFLTTTGWTGFLYMIFGVPFYLIILLILVFKSFFSRISFHIDSWKYLLVIQGLFLLINFGDCGDGDGLGSNFFQRLLQGTNMFEPCYVTKISAPLIPVEAVGVVLVAYIFFLLRLILGLPELNLKPQSLKKKIVASWEEESKK